MDKKLAFVEKVIFLPQIIILILFRQYKRAQKLCEAYIVKDPNKSLFYEYLGLVCQRKGEVDNAIKWYKKALELAPDILMDRLDLIPLLYTKKQYDEIIRYGMEILATKQRGLLERIKPAFFDTLYWYLAASYHYLGKYQQAAEFYEKLRFYARYKNDPEIYECLGYCYYKLNQNDKAIEACRRALQLGSDKKNIITMIDELQARYP